MMPASLMAACTSAEKNGTCRSTASRPSRAQARRWASRRRSAPRCAAPSMVRGDGRNGSAGGSMQKKICERSPRLEPCQATSTGDPGGVPPHEGPKPTRPTLMQVGHPPETSGARRGHGRNSRLVPAPEEVLSKVNSFSFEALTKTRLTTSKANQRTFGTLGSCTWRR